MKTWQREGIECMLILIFLGYIWWWTCREYQKPPKTVTAHAHAVPVKIYNGAWKKGGYLEVKK